MNPQRQQVIFLRAQLYALIRQFFAERKVLEVETPLLSRAGNTDPNIASFSLQFIGPDHAGDRQRWLRTSPEYPLKRLLAEGLGDCYELGRVFRNGEAGGRHNPEFTMLEWYRLGWDHHRLIDETIVLVSRALHLVNRQPGTIRLSYAQLYQQHCGVDPHRASIDQLRQAQGDTVLNPEQLNRDDWLDLLMTHQIQPSFPPDQITVVYDYPASQCALAKIRDDNPPVAERFELYLGSLELANGYHELTDAIEQRKRFERDTQIRLQRGLETPSIDEALLTALIDLPNCAGVALGIDRLLMAMLDTDKIAEALAFDFSRA